MTAAFPLPRQTGHADFPHPAFAWRYCMIHSQFDQSKTAMEILVKGYAFRAFPWSLTAPSQMSGHSQPHIVVDLPISLFGFHAQLLSPVTEFRRQARFPYGQFSCRFSCHRLVSHPNQLRSFLSPLRSCQGPLAPRALPRFLATTGLSDSPTARTQLISSLRSLPRFSRSQRPGSPLLPNPTFPARCPSLPRRTPTLLLNVSSHRMTGFNTSGRLAVLLCLTRPSWVRDFSLRLAGSLCAASTRQLPVALCASLHAGRSVGMVNTFQFTSWVGGCGLHLI